MWQLIINGPGYFDTTYDLPDGVTCIGRADTNDIVLSGDQVSRRHARIEVNGGTLTVEDLGSRNGMRINDVPLKGIKRVKPGDVLRIGENLLSVRQPSDFETAKTDPIDFGQFQASGLHGIDSMGEVLVSRGVEDNPFLERYEEVERLSPAQLKSSPPVEDVESLFLLIKVSEKLNTSPSLKSFLEAVIDLVAEVAQATTGVALTKDSRGKLVPAVVRHRDKLRKGEVPVSDSIINEVVRKKVALAVMNAKDDARFASSESVILYDLDQVICAPMLREGELVGVIYLNREAQETASLSRLVDVVNAIAHMAANGIEKWRLKEKAAAEERVRKALERFHAPAIVERVISDLQSGRHSGSRMEAKVVTIMFADISGFTPLTERLPPERVVDLLNEYYARMTRVIFSFDGTVDKFIGDAVMAIFGAPYSRPDDASRAVRCALACRREFVEMIMSRPVDERCGITIGLNTGTVLAGTLGSEERIEYTALGDAVNVAARVQSTAKPGQVLITGPTLAAIGARFDVAPMGERELKGKVKKVPVFEVLDEDSDCFTMPGVDTGRFR
ncbi:MAG: adenylate/guanylate cyclase domain-containing protein [Myxococcales bacterium]|jgi:adenylate cyclase